MSTLTLIEFTIIKTEETMGYNGRKNNEKIIVDCFDGIDGTAGICR